MMPGRLLGLVGRRPSNSYSAAKETAKNALHAVKKDKSTTSLRSEDSESRRPSMDHFKRHSIGGKHGDKKASSSPRLESTKSAKLDMVVESPPLVSYGLPAESTGALFSSQLRLDVLDCSITLESFEARLNCVVTNKKPVEKHCHDCITQITELKKFTFTKEHLNLKRGQHAFPVSYLFGGHLPATTRGALTTLEYHFSAVAKLTTGETLRQDRHIDLKRAIMPGADKLSTRIFPPTNLAAHVTLPPVIHPIGEFRVELRLTGTTTKRENGLSRWVLRKLNWRIEEHEKSISPACPKHAQKVGGEGKGLQHEEDRVIGEKDIKHGWKTDHDEGQVEYEFDAAVNPALKPVCDVEAPNGLKVAHNLVLELVVAEEFATAKNPRSMIATGAARILRTSFHVIVSERAGMGISWDLEAPPMYENVPASPPTYTQLEDFDLNELDGEVEHLAIGEPVARGGIPSYQGSTPGEERASSSGNPG